MLDRDGSVHTTAELFLSQTTRDELIAHMKQGSRSSDTLWLLWKQSVTIELRTVEEQLRYLSEKIVPGIPTRFSTYEEPRYRAALRMQLAEIPIPAAIGGVLNPEPGFSDSFSAASVTIPPYPINFPEDSLESCLAVVPPATTE